MLAILPPNRVRRTYRGGAGLDRLEGVPTPVDDDRPEDWVGSTVPASNPGMPAIANEGLSRLADGSLLLDRIAQDPQGVLGDACRSDPGFLFKILDAAVDLPLQAHPTSAWAREKLGKPFGKFEAYVVLAVRPGSPGCLRLGFQRPPSRAQWRRMVLDQDLAAMQACFDPIPVQPGEVWYVPGGLPHAIGAGLLLLEAMEPSDLVVRCEFSRNGIHVPPAARFMGVDPDLALDCFDHTAYSVDAVRRRFRLAPRPIDHGPGWRREELLPSGLTPAFTLSRWMISGRARVPCERRFRVGVVASGSARMADLGRVQIGSRLLLAADAAEVELDGSCTIVWCEAG